MDKTMNSGMGKVSAVLLTAIVTFFLTAGLGAVLIASYGTERVAEEVSPFVQTAQKRLTEGVVPPSERQEPKTEADLIMDAVASTQGSSVLVYREEGASGETFVARGLLVTTDGLVVTDTEALARNATYTVAVPGVKDRLVVQKSARFDDAFTVLSVSYTSALLPKFSDMGVEGEQLVVAVTGDKNQRIATGIVTEVLDGSVRTNLVGTITPGSVLVSKEGFVVGVSTVHAQGGGQVSFTPLTKADISDLRDVMDVMEAEM